MASKLKKIIAVAMAAMMLTSVPCMTMAEEVTEETATNAAATEEKAGAVKFTIGEADENGIFTAKLSLHNVEFLGMQFGIQFNKDAIVVVDEEGNPAKSLDNATVFNPFVTEDKEIQFTAINKALSNEEGLLQVMSVTTQTGGKHLIAPEEGFVAYEFRFKVIGEGDYGFDLVDYPFAQYVKEAMVSDGRGGQSFRFDFVYPASYKLAENAVTHYDFGPGRSEPKPETKPDTEEPGTEEPGTQTPDTNIPDPVEPPADTWQDERLDGTVVLQIGAYAVSVEGVIKWVDKDNKNVVPYIENDRTMVPLRFISESMGAEVEWIAESRTIRIRLDDTAIEMQIDNTEYRLNGDTKTMDAAPVIREDRTFVPLRFVSEALGKSVTWDGNLGVVVVAPLDYPWDNTDPQTMELYTRTLMTMKWLGDEAYANDEK